MLRQSPSTNCLGPLLLYFKSPLEKRLQNDTLQLPGLGWAMRIPPKVLLLGGIATALAGVISASLPARAQNVTTQAYDNSRSGAYLFETKLTPATVQANTFGNRGR